MTDNSHSANEPGPDVREIPSINVHGTNSISGGGDNNNKASEKRTTATDSVPPCTASTSRTKINASKEQAEQQGTHRCHFSEDVVKVMVTPSHNSELHVSGQIDCNNQASTSTTTTDVVVSQSNVLRMVKSTSLRSISGRLNNNCGNATARDASQQSSKTTRLCIYICVIYISLTMPNITTQLLFHAIPTLSKSSTMSDIYIVAYMLSLLNTVSNPFVYAIMHKTFCAEMKIMWKRISNFILDIACFHYDEDLA
ncbi:uncharacterized protein LOC134839974 [Symsagittifera roscoffensis]|uniref:uncharacterized protein LOC134839974 n=1 Tax=Symsagittifera roscoffensis TaxID=84072 RepID=UPI00307B7F92